MIKKVANWIIYRDKIDICLSKQIGFNNIIHKTFSIDCIENNLQNILNQISDYKKELNKYSHKIILDTSLFENGEIAYKYDVLELDDNAVKLLNNEQSLEKKNQFIYSLVSNQVQKNDNSFNAFLINKYIALSDKDEDKLEKKSYIDLPVNKKFNKMQINYGFAICLNSNKLKLIYKLQELIATDNKTKTFYANDLISNFKSIDHNQSLKTLQIVVNETEILLNFLNNNFVTKSIKIAFDYDRFISELTDDDIQQVNNIDATLLFLTNVIKNEEKSLELPLLLQHKLNIINNNLSNIKNQLNFTLKSFNLNVNQLNLYVAGKNEILSNLFQEYLTKEFAAKFKVATDDYQQLLVDNSVDKIDNNEQYQNQTITHTIEIKKNWNRFSLYKVRQFFTNYFK